jgi:hypothetical protein
MIMGVMQNNLSKNDNVLTAAVRKRPATTTTPCLSNKCSK